MKTPHDNPADTLGSLGAPIRPAAPPAPDPVKAFEHINDQAKVVKPIVDSIKKPSVEPGAVEDWQGCDLRLPGIVTCGCIHCQGLDLSDAYTQALLGCI